MNEQTPGQVDDLDSFTALLREESAVFIYFGGDNCSVCKTLRPQVFRMLSEFFPRMRLVYVDAEKASEVTGQSGVFCIPTMIAFFDGKETLRKERNTSMGELRAGLARPYSLYFD